MNGTGTTFLYDRVTPVQEVAASNTTTLLTGLGVDEYYVRTGPTGSSSLLSDVLGSTVALADSSATVRTTYTYEPFGTTSVSGATDANPYQFTGRENDGTGLYYYRARYFHPGLQRFISQDPVGAQDGKDLYAYVGGNPLLRVDPFGLAWEYSQSSGMLIHVDDESGTKTAEGWGYAGAGIGLFNPAMQHVRDLGPLPQGSYTIGPQRDNTIFVRNQRVTLPGSMKLTPTGDTTCWGGRAASLFTEETTRT